MTNSPSDIHHHIDAVMCRGSTLPPRLQGEFSTRESKNRKPDLAEAAAWESKKTRAASEEVSKQVQFKSTNLAPDQVGDGPRQAERPRALTERTNGSRRRCDGHAAQLLEREGGWPKIGDREREMGKFDVAFRRRIQRDTP